MESSNLLLEFCEVDLLIAISIQNRKDDAEVDILLSDIVFELCFTSLKFVLIDV